MHHVVVNVASLQHDKLANRYLVYWWKLSLIGVFRLSCLEYGSILSLLRVTSLLSREHKLKGKYRPCPSIPNFL